MFAVVVLAGGAARRVGGASKPALQVGGRSLLNRVLDAVDSARPRIVVGPADLAGFLANDVVTTREHPPGGGPVAAIAAGLSRLPPIRPGDQVGVFAGDLPFLTAEVVEALRTTVAVDGAGLVDGAVLTDGAGSVDGSALADGAVLVDDAGRSQWLAGVWRADRLAARLADLGDPDGRSMRQLVDGLRIAHVRVSASAGPPPWFDCDTEDDLRRAEEWANGHIG